MSDYYTKDTVLDAVDSIKYRRGTTDLGYAINYTLDKSLTPKAGARDGVQKVRQSVFF